MKKLILSFLFIGLFSYCQALQSTLDDFAHKVFNAVKNNDQALFQSLYLTSYELEGLIAKRLIVVRETDPQTPIDFYKGETYTEIKNEKLTSLKIYSKSKGDMISFYSVDSTIEKNIPLYVDFFRIHVDVFRDPNSKGKGLDIYNVAITYLINGVKLELGEIQAVMLPANLTPSSPERLAIFL